MGWLPTGPASGGATRERWESLAAVLALAQEVAASGRHTMLELVEEFERRAAISHAPTADGITVTTLHAAKGLEWPVVFIVGASEGGLPIVYADTPERIEEERRLFYVGVTRARDRLVISWALSRAGSARHREPSRFLSAITSRRGAGGPAAPAGLVRRGGSSARPAPARRPAARCRTCDVRLITADELTLGRCSRCPSDADPVLVEALHAWRAAAAEADGTAQNAILRDLTLQAIAERRPTTEQQLAEIPEFRPDKLARHAEAVLGLVAESLAVS
jgi:DNA helicase-2/ATP-dependent DNA helicase PcrA